MRAKRLIEQTSFVHVVVACSGVLEQNVITRDVAEAARGELERKVLEILSQQRDQPLFLLAAAASDQRQGFEIVRAGLARWDGGDLGALHAEALDGGQAWAVATTSGDPDRLLPLIESIEPESNQSELGRSLYRAYVQGTTCFLSAWWDGLAISLFVDRDGGETGSRLVSMLASGGFVASQGVSVLPPGTVT